MISFPKAKINLGLRVVGKREDGFHNIETVFYPIGLSDALEFVVQEGKGKEDELVISGIDIRTKPEKNLVIKAVRLVRERYALPPLKIHLHKAIPPGAGLGGGSADASCMIKSINKRFRFGMPEEEMQSMALEIGSDCPFFLNPVPSAASGRGEILEPVDPVLKDYYIVLLNPRIIINTREAYHNCIPIKREGNLGDMIRKPVTSWKKTISNDFEEFVFKVHPVAGDLKKSLYRAGAVYSSMTGSGSTVYGIFKSKPAITDIIKEYLIYEGWI